MKELAGLFVEKETINILLRFFGIENNYIEKDDLILYGLNNLFIERHVTLILLEYYGCSKEETEVLQNIVIKETENVTEDIISLQDADIDDSWWIMNGSGLFSLSFWASTDYSFNLQMRIIKTAPNKILLDEIYDPQIESKVGKCPVCLELVYDTGSVRCNESKCKCTPELYLSNLSIIFRCNYSNDLIAQYLEIILQTMGKINTMKHNNKINIGAIPVDFLLYKMFNML